MRKYYKKRATVKRVTDLILGNNNQSDYTVKYNEEQEDGSLKEIVLCHGIDIISNLKLKFDSFELCHVEETPNPEIEEIRFLWVYSMFVESHIESFYRIYKSISSKYEPIENYDRLEDSTTTDGRSMTRTNNLTTVNADTRVVTHSGNDSNTESGSIDHNYNSGSRSEDNNSVTRKERSESSDTFLNVSKDEVVDNKTLTLDETTDYQNHKNDLEYGHVVTNSGALTVTDTGTVTDANSGDLHTVSHIHGNIGVTTNQQMIESEIDLRLKASMVDIIVEMFAGVEVI